jgi:hypothetical protein
MADNPQVIDKSDIKNFYFPVGEKTVGVMKDVDERIFIYTTDKEGRLVSITATEVLAKLKQFDNNEQPISAIPSGNHEPASLGNLHLRQAVIDDMSGRYKKDDALVFDNPRTIKMMAEKSFSHAPKTDNRANIVVNITPEGKIVPPGYEGRLMSTGLTLNVDRIGNVHSACFEYPNHDDLKGDDKNLIGNPYYYQMIAMASIEHLNLQNAQRYSTGADVKKPVDAVYLINNLSYRGTFEPEGRQVIKESIRKGVRQLFKK